MKTKRISSIKSFFNFRIVYYSILLLLIMGCGSGDLSEADAEDYNDLLNLIENREFVIEHNWASPLGGNQINLIGNPNQIRFFNDSVDVFLPYFGVRQSGSGYDNSGGIDYKGPVRNFSIEEKKNKIVMEFEGRQGTENYEFTINLFPNKNVSTSVNSSQRQTISYRGIIEEVEKDKQ